MNIMQNLASSIGDVLNLMLGKDFETQFPPALDQYPNLKIR